MLKTLKLRRSKEVKITKYAEIQNISKYIFLIRGLLAPQGRLTSA